MISNVYAPYHAIMTASNHTEVKMREARATGDTELADEWRNALRIVNALAEYRHALWQMRGGRTKDLWPLAVRGEETEREHQQDVNAIRYSGAW